MYGLAPGKPKHLVYRNFYLAIPLLLGGKEESVISELSYSG